MIRWHDDEECQAALNDLLGTLDAAPELLPLKCGKCEHHSVHVYFNDHQVGRGGVWAWCSACACYLHAGTRVPPWWRNMESFDEGRLSAVPAYLNEMAEALDAHWNDLLPR